MVSINDKLISTSLRSASPIVNQAEVSDSVAQMNANYEEQMLRKLDQEKANAKRETLQNQEIQYQAKSALSRINDDVQKASLSALYTIAEIDYTNYKANEAELASSFLLNKTAEAEFQLDSEYNNILSKAGSNGEGILEGTQSWINSKLLELEEKAPNALAKSKLQQWGANFKFKALGKAVQDADKFRKDNSSREIQETVNLYSGSLMKDPYAFDLTEKLDLVRSTFRAKGFNENEAGKETAKVEQSLLEARIRGSINTNNFKLAKDLYLQDVTKLNPEKAKTILTTLEAAEKRYNKTVLKDLKKTDTEQRFMDGTLTRSELNDKEISDILDNQFKGVALAAEKLLEQGDVSGYVNGLTQLISQRPDLPLKAYDDYFVEALSSVKNPTKTISVAQVIRNLSSDPKTLPVLESLSAETKARAELISRRSPMVDPIAAINQTNEILALDSTTRNFYKSNLHDKLKENPISAKQIESKLGLTHWWESTPDNLNDLEVDYHRSLQDYFTLTKGDFKVAQDLALQDLRSTYRISEINGTKEAVRYPIEYFFPKEETKVADDYIAENLKQTFKGVNQEDRTILLSDENGIKVSTKYKILPIEGITNNQKGADKVTYKIVNAELGREWEILHVLDIPKNLNSQKKQKEARAWVDAEINSEKRLKEEYAKLKALNNANPRMLTPTLIGK